MARRRTVDELTGMHGKRRPWEPLKAPPPPRYPLWFRALAIGVIVNFFAFVAGAAWFGGDAFNGYTEGERYFLSWAKQDTEVSRAVFLYSKWHAVSVAVTFAGVALCGYMLRRRLK